MRSSWGQLTQTSFILFIAVDLLSQNLCFPSSKPKRSLWTSNKLLFSVPKCGTKNVSLFLQMWYSCRYLRSDTYKQNMTQKRIVISAFGTRSLPDPCQNAFKRLAKQKCFVHELIKLDLFPYMSIRSQSSIAGSSCAQNTAGIPQNRDAVLRKKSARETVLTSAFGRQRSFMNAYDTFLRSLQCNLRSACRFQNFLRRSVRLSKRTKSSVWVLENCQMRDVMSRWQLWIGTFKSWKRSHSCRSRIIAIPKGSEYQ